MADENPKSHETPDQQLLDGEQVIADSRRGVKSLSVSRKLQIGASYEELECHVPEVSSMKGVDQRSDFHTLTLDEHTRQLGRNLESDSFVAEHPKRELILLAGKLHDIGKMSPEGQQIHPKDPEKRQYKNHEAESERMTRELLPRHFDLSQEDQDFVVGLTGLHASALNLVNNFQDDNQPKGKALKAYDEFMAKAEEIPGNMDLEEKMRIIFAINRADKGAGYNAESDLQDEKTRTVKDKADKQIAVLNEMEKALPALVKAVIARRGGDQTAGILLADGVYYYNKETPGQEKEKKTEIPQALKTLGGVLKDKMRLVAEVYDTLVAKKDNQGAMQGLVNGILRKKLDLTDEQVAAVLGTLK